MERDAGILAALDEDFRFLYLDCSPHLDPPTATDSRRGVKPAPRKPPVPAVVRCGNPLTFAVACRWGAKSRCVISRPCNSKEGDWRPQPRFTHLASVLLRQDQRKRIGEGTGLSAEGTGEQ